MGEGDGEVAAAADDPPGRSIDRHERELGPGIAALHGGLDDFAHAFLVGDREGHPGPDARVEAAGHEPREMGEAHRFHPDVVAVELDRPVKVETEVHADIVRRVERSVRWFPGR